MKRSNLFSNLKYISILSLLSTSAFADMFHYNNVIIGERAQGMGGAYTAVADDASGVYYNPAGLAFAQSNDISGSANAFYSRKVTYKEVFEGQNFTETSNGTFAPFFGAMQKLDHFMTGLVGGFAYYSLDTELTDQNDLIQNAVVDSTTTYNVMRRTMNRRASTVGASVGLGYRLTPSLSLGVSLTYLTSEDLIQSYLSIDITQTDGTTTKRSINSRNVRQKLSTFGLEPTIGVQWAPATKFSFGLSVRQGQYASQKLEQNSHTTAVAVTSNATAGSSPDEVKSSNPIGSMPMQIKAGVAYFASPELLLTADVSQIAAVNDMSSELKVQYKREAVMNEAVGMEYFMTPSLPLRVGVFTNNDSRKTANIYQGEKIDYLGLSTFLAWAQPNSQISLGTVVQQGTGKGQKVSTAKTEKVEAFAYTVGFSATHSF